ncbi:MAG: hypothetical protein HYY00_01850 [Chloroflexi bacterium]|nr:hypothetical protein [Chloroflexota bacterium]
MGLAKINVWVSAMDDPCGVANRVWYITIYDCDGNVLQWCGKKYVVLPAPCGHLEVEVPPGCYYIKGVWGYTVVRPGFEYRVNHFTDAAIVQACCEETACVKLFNPSAHRCGSIIVRAVADLLKQKLVKPETARKVNQAMEELLAQLPRPIKEFELGHMDEIEKLVQEQEAQAQKEQRQG